MNYFINNHILRNNDIENEDGVTINKYMHEVLELDLSNEKKKEEHYLHYKSRQVSRLIPVLNFARNNTTCATNA